MAGTLIVLKPMAAAPVNGAEISMFERLRLLQREFHWKVEMVCTSLEAHRPSLERLLDGLGIAISGDRDEIRYQVNEVPVCVRFGATYDAYAFAGREPVKEAFRQMLTGRRPDVLITNFTDFFALDFMVTEWKGGSLFFVTDNEYPRPETLAGSRELEEIARHVRKVKNVVVASTFLQESLKSSWNFDAQLFLNPINLDRYRRSGTEKGDAPYITMINPISVKGVDLFLEIARRMPEERFLAVGGWGEEIGRRRKQLSQLSNLKIVTYERDMDRIYAQSRLVLVPSLWEEAFGRVVLEALASGTPVIASETGGLREAGGDGALYLRVNKMRFGEPVKPQDPVPWIEMIGRFKDDLFYRQRVDAALERAAAYERLVRESMGRLNGYLESLISIIC